LYVGFEIPDRFTMTSPESNQIKKKKADLKVVIVADADVGKTCLLHRYLHGEFYDQTPNTIGAAFFLKQWGSYNIAIWDTAGEERFSGLSSFYCRGANAAVVCYDIRSRNTFQSIEDRYTALLETAAENCSIVISGTKKDLVSDSNREVTAEIGAAKAKELCERWNSKLHESGRCPFFETSSLTGENVKALFEHIFETLTQGCDKTGADKSDTVDLEEKKNCSSKSRSKCSC